MIDIAITAFTAFFITVEPVALVPLFLALVADRDVQTKRAVAVSATLIAGAVLSVFLVGGRLILDLLGISLEALKVGAGIMLFLVAVDMVLARQSGLRGMTSQENAEASKTDDVVVFPLAVPLIAGPAAITTAILYGSQTFGDWPAFVVVALMLAAVLTVTGGALLGGAHLSKWMGVTATNVVSRVLGIILGGMAAQIVLEGLTAFLSG